MSHHNLSKDYLRHPTNRGKCQPLDSPTIRAINRWNAHLLSPIASEKDPRTADLMRELESNVTHIRTCLYLLRARHSKVYYDHSM